MKPDIPHDVKSAVSGKARTDPSLGGGETHPREGSQYNGKEKKERMRFQGLVLFLFILFITKSSHLMTSHSAVVVHITHEDI